MKGFGGMNVVVWAASGLAILLAPFCQVCLHRWLSAGVDHPARRIGAYNHAVLLTAFCLWAIHILSMEPGARLLVSMLVALPSSAVTVLLWLILAIRCHRSLEQ